MDFFHGRTIDAGVPTLTTVTNMLTIEDVSLARYVASMRLSHLIFFVGVCFTCSAAAEQNPSIINSPSGVAAADTSDPAQAESIRLADAANAPAIVVISNQKTRSSVSVAQSEIKKILPGESLKSLT